MMTAVKGRKVDVVVVAACAAREPKGSGWVVLLLKWTS